MQFFTLFAIVGLAVLFELPSALGAPTTTCKTPKSTSTPKHTPKASATRTKHTPSSSSAKVTITSATSNALVSPIACPAPTVPLGGGGPFATTQGRMFNIQSQTQFFAGRTTSRSPVYTPVDLCLGTNSWWLSQLQSNADVDTVFSQLALVSACSRSPLTRTLC